MKTSFFSLKLPWKNRGRRYILRFPLHFFTGEVQLAAFFGHFSAFWTEVWIGSFDRIYGRRRRGPARRRKRSEPWQLSGIAGWFTYQVWGEIEANFCFPPFFLCFPCMSCLRLFCHFVCFWSSRMQWRTKDQQRTLKLTLGTRITCAHGWVIRNTTSVDGERQALVDICEQEREKAKQHFQVEVKDRFFGSKIRVLRCEMISCIFLLHFVLHVLKIRWDTI